MRTIIATLGGLALVLGNLGCGGGGNDTTCGAGTTLDNGICVSTGTDVTCAAGTTLEGTECVPDGTVICETGTMYDANTGTCVADITGCAAGTVLVSGECVPDDDTLVADVQEADEPNGPEVGATTLLLTLPTVGSDVIINGCVGPTPDYDLNDNGDGDLDYYVLEADAPSLLDITVDGVGGMAGAFRILSLDSEMRGDGWIRYGYNLVGDMTQRQVYLPKAGRYLMIIADARTFYLGEGIGDGTNTCYFATVAHVATPAPTAITGTQVTGQMSPDAQFYSYTPTDGERVDLTFNMETVSTALDGSLVTMIAGSYGSSVETPGPVTDSAKGLTTADSIVYVVETSYDTQLSPVDFTLDLTMTAGVSLGAADSTNTVTVDNDGGTHFYFDGTAGEVVSIDFDATAAGESFTANLYNRRGAHLGQLFDTVESSNIWAQLPATGRYSVVVENTSTATGTTDVDFTRTHLTPETLTYGTPATSVTLGGDGLSFYRLSITTTPWIDTFLAATDFGGNGLIHVVGSQQVLFGLDAPGPAEYQNIGNGFGGEMLIVVEDSDFASATGTPTFDLSIGEQTFSNSMTVDEANPVALGGITLDADTSLYYYFLVGWDADFTVTVQGSQDLILRELDQFAEGGDIDGNGTGAAESFNDATQAPTWVAFEVLEKTGTADTVTVNIDVLDPSYSTTFTDVNLSNACATGTRVEMAAGTSDVLDIGFTFPFFGVDMTQLIVAENGWMTFDTTYAGDGSNNDWGVDTLAVYDTDDFYELRDLCIDKQADHTTVQWRLTEIDMNEFALVDVEAQLILWSNGDIDFRWGSLSQFSTSATVDVFGILGNAVDVFDRPYYDTNLSMLMSPN